MNRIALFVISEFPQDPDKDTSYLFMLEAQKRGFDIIFRLSSLALLSPLLLVISLLVRLSSKGAILYKQERLGLHGKKFIMLK